MKQNRPARPQVPDRSWILRCAGKTETAHWITGTSPGIHFSNDLTVPDQGRTALKAAYAAFCLASRPRLTSSSAICTVLSAAPLRRLSETTHMDRPESTVESSRMREM